MHHTLLLMFAYHRCLNHCTYCKTKHARGELGSYPVEDIVERARQAFSGIRSFRKTRNTVKNEVLYM